MDNYIYRVYGTRLNTGYILILKTSSLQEAYSILQNKSFLKIMVIRHDVLQNMDEIMTIKYNNNFTRKLKKKNGG